MIIHNGLIRFGSVRFGFDSDRIGILKGRKILFYFALIFAVYSPSGEARFKTILYTMSFPTNKQTNQNLPIAI